MNPVYVHGQFSSESLLKTWVAGGGSADQYWLGTGVIVDLHWLKHLKRVLTWTGVKMPCDEPFPASLFDFFFIAELFLLFFSNNSVVNLKPGLVLTFSLISSIHNIEMRFCSYFLIFILNFLRKSWWYFPKWCYHRENSIIIKNLKNPKSSRNSVSGYDA